jgi:uncharacterized integral membrane protein
VSVRRWLPALGVTLFAAVFTWLNRGERVAVDLGLFTVYRAPLTMVAFLAFVAGMLAMMLLSLRHDRRVREELRARGLLEPAPPRAAAPVASAWGVAREPARQDERTVAYPREDERAYPRLDEGVSHPNDRATAFSRGDENDDRTSAYPRLDADAGPDPDRTAGYPRLDADDGRDDDRTTGYPRLDKDPAA